MPKPARLPKRIAGIKLPRTVRKALDPWLAELDQAQVRTLIGTALGAVVVALVEREFGSDKGASLKRRFESLAEGNDRDGLAGTIAHALASALGRRDTPTAH